MVARPHHARWIPVVIATLCIGTSLLLALSAQRAEPETTSRGLPITSSPSPSTSSASSNTAVDTARPLPSYQPLLSEGPDIGELLIADADAGHALVVVQDQLVWLSGERAQVLVAPLAGGEPRVLFVSDTDDDFGGALVTTPAQRRVFWLVERVGSEQEPIYQAQLQQGRWSKPTVIARGGSPASLSAADDRLYWSNLGNIMRWSPETMRVEQLHERNQRIAAMVAGKNVLFWIETPYAATSTKPTTLLRWSSASPEPTALSSALSQRAEQLLVHAEQLLWTQQDAEGKHHILTVSSHGGGTPTRLGATGPVTAMTKDSSALYWVESYDESDGGIISVLRKRDVASGAVSRIGRIAGSVGSLSLAGKRLYWLSNGGVRRHAI